MADMAPEEEFLELDGEGAPAARRNWRTGAAPPRRWRSGDVASVLRDSSPPAGSG